MEKDKQLGLIKEYIQSQYQMVIATTGDHPWIATVYYSFDDELNLYFLSNPATIHCQQILQNPQVAVSIADSPQPANAKKIGVQIYGLAEQISGEKKITHALNLWRKSLNVTSDAYTYKGMMSKLIDGRMYMVTPKKIKFFNQELWEEGEEPLIEL